MSTVKSRSSLLVILSLAFGWGMGSLGLKGCGPTRYAATIADARDVVELARRLDAAAFAPFELTYAELHLEKAREEAAQAAYQDAVRYAEVARVYGEKAVALSEQQRPDDRGSEPRP